MMLLKIILFTIFTVIMVNCWKEKIKSDFSKEDEYNQWLKTKSMGYSYLKLALLVVVPPTIILLVVALLSIRVETTVGLIGSLPKITQKLYDSNRKVFDLEKLGNDKTQAQVKLTATEWVLLLKWVSFKMLYNFQVSQAKKNYNMDLQPL